MKLVNSEMLNLIAGGCDDDAAEAATTYEFVVDVTFEEVSVNGTDVLAPTEVSVSVHENA